MQSPFAQVQMSIDSGAPVFGGQTVVGNNNVQLSAVSSVGWISQLWEIYEYAPTFALPSGWTNVNGVYQSSAVTPTPFVIPAASTTWGKYLFRLTVNGSLLNGVYMGPGTTQPLVDIASGIQVLSPIFGFNDIGYQEANQFDAVRQWVGPLRNDLRLLESYLAAHPIPAYSPYSALYSLASNFTTTSSTATASNLLFALGANDIVWVEFEGTIQCSSTGGVKASFTLPTGAVIEGTAFGGTSQTGITASRITAGSQLTTAFETTATTPNRVSIRARIKGDGTNAGNVVLNFASGTNGQTTTAFAGATLKVTKTTEV